MEVLSNLELIDRSQINFIGKNRSGGDILSASIDLNNGNLELCSNDGAKLNIGTEFSVYSNINGGEKMFSVVPENEGCRTKFVVSSDTFRGSEFEAQSLNIHAANNSVLGEIDATCSGSHGSAFRISSKARDLELKNEYVNSTNAISKITLMPAEIEAYTYCFRVHAKESINLRADNGSCSNKANVGEISLYGGSCQGGTVISLRGGGIGGSCKTNIEFSGVNDVLFCSTNVNVIDSNIVVDSGHIEINDICTPHLIFNGKGEQFAYGKKGYVFEIGSTLDPQSYIIHRNIFDESQNCVGFIRFDFPNILPETCTIDVGFKLDNILKGSRTEFVALKSDIPTVNHLEFANPTIPANCSLYEVSLAPTTFTKTPIMQLTNKSGAAQVADLCYNKTSNKVFVGIDHTTQIAAGEYKLSVFGM